MRPNCNGVQVANALVDGFGRVHDYLRISLTDKCNLRCTYCMPEEDYQFMAGQKLMQAVEIFSLAKVFMDLGVRKIRLTGGEPLVRKDAAQIIRHLSTLPLELTITTNATRLHEFTDDLQLAGMKSINISLDTLDRNKYQLLTRRDAFPQVYNNIHQAIQMGFHVKLNVVVMRNVNDNELNAFVALTRDLPIHVRFIEFMPFDGNAWKMNNVVTLQEILNTISQDFDFLPLERHAHDTAKKFIVPGHKGTFAVISTMSNHFCGDCNRMRLTADGKLKNCLFSTSETDLLTPLRSGLPVQEMIASCIRQKRAILGGQFTEEMQTIIPEQLQNRSMIAIGG